MVRNIVTKNSFKLAAIDIVQIVMFVAFWLCCLTMFACTGFNVRYFLIAVLFEFELIILQNRKQMIRFEELLKNELITWSTADKTVIAEICNSKAGVLAARYIIPVSDVDSITYDELGSVIDVYGNIRISYPGVSVFSTESHHVRLPIDGKSDKKVLTMLKSRKAA